MSTNPEARGGTSPRAASEAAAPRTESRTLEVEGAVLTYDVRGNAASTEAPLMLIGSPMGASGFGSLASRFADRTVVTYDPRGVERSIRTDGGGPLTPAQHAEDVARLIAELGGGPVDLFASSGGAINALALVAERPELVRTLVAHEPPLLGFLPEREVALRLNRQIHDTYHRHGFGPAMARFIIFATHRGELPEGLFGGPTPDPAAFGFPVEDDGSRDDPLLSQNILSSVSYEPDLGALKGAPTRLVLAVGADSAGEAAHRATLGLAEELGVEPVPFPGGHGGFLGGEYGQQGEPDAFAAKLRGVLEA